MPPGGPFRAVTQVLGFLATNPLLALVLIMAVGLALGKVRIFGLSLGAAAVLFVAIALSTANPEITVPPLLFQMGLAMFVYAIGLSAGERFFAEFKDRGWKLNLFLILLLMALVALAWGLVTLFHLKHTTGAGMFAGALSSTPGMAAIVSMVRGTTPELAAEPVIGYSLAYPGGVLGAILVAAIGAKVFKVDHRADARKEGLLPGPLLTQGIRIRPGLSGTLGELSQLTGVQIIATRIVKDEKHHELAEPSDPIRPGEVIVINGTRENIDCASEILGEQVEVDIDGTDLLYQRFTVSNSAVAGHAIKELNTTSRGFLISRLRRGDSDVVPSQDAVLNYSDRVLVVAPEHMMDRIRGFLGDSERRLAEVDLLSFALGLTLGLLVGAIPIPLPGGNVLNLGFGGGPIVVGLILGALQRSGPIQWQLPYHANRTISTLGLVLFLAGVGTTAGAGFRSALTDPESLKFIAVGFIITVASALVCGLAGRWILHLTWDESMGVAAGMTTNPAIISYLNGQTGTELATRGYATVYPSAMIGKIIACQVLLILLT